jgi:hypothetical protein
MSVAAPARSRNLRRATTDACRAWPGQERSSSIVFSACNLHKKGRSNAPRSAAHEHPCPGTDRHWPALDIGYRNLHAIVLAAAAKADTLLIKWGKRAACGKLMRSRNSPYCSAQNRSAAPLWPMR